MSEFVDKAMELHEEAVGLSHSAGMDEASWERGRNREGAEKCNQVIEITTALRAHLEAREAEARARVEVLEAALSRLCSHKTRTSAEIDADWDSARAALTQSKEQA